MHQTPLYSAVDGNAALAHIAYGVTDVALVYPAADGDNVGQGVTKLAEDNMPNCFGGVCQVAQIDTKTGAAAAALGSLSTGALSTVFCSSQSLTEMLPALHKLTIERVPAVFHVAASGMCSNMKEFPDYSQVFRCAHSGFGILHSNSVQECHDLALVAHLAASRVSLPFLHFYDGTRTAHEVVKAQLIPYSKLSKVCESLADKDFRPAAVPKKRIPDVIDDVMAQMRRVFKRRYRIFEYSGSASAEIVVVSLCSQEETAALSFAVARAAAQGKRVGLLQVRLLRPWSSRHFLQALPLGTLKRCVVVVGAKTDSAAKNILYSDVIASVPLGHGAQVCSTKFRGSIDASSATALLSCLSDASVPSEVVIDEVPVVDAPALRADIKKVITWAKAAPGTNPVLELAQILGESTPNCVHAMQVQDAYNLGGMVVSTHMHLSLVAFAAPALACSTAPADYVCVGDIALLDMFNVTAQLKTGGTLLINTPAKTQDEVESCLPATLRKDLAARKIKLFAMDTTEFAEDESHLVNQLGLLLLNDMVDRPTLGEAAEYVKSALGFPLAHQQGMQLKQVQEIITKMATNLAPVSVPEQWVSEVIPEPEVKEGEEAVPPIVLPTHIEQPSYVRACVDLPQKESCQQNEWHKAAQHLMFPEAFKCQDSHRPGDSEKEKSFVIKVGKNLRVTPDTYDRNVFHIEFDTTNTGLKYEIGDALGVYARNRQCDVQQFLEFYGLNGRDTVTLQNKNGYDEIRTAQHVCARVLDLFGRPSRRFYEALAPFAKDSKEQAKLEWLSGKEGGHEFKKRVEATVTFASILTEFASAKPTLSELVQLVPAIKPRHYSIASSMSMHPNSVHLLVVLVSWTTPSGEQRYGQATKYMVDLEVGAEVSVCVKPSVMTLPTDPMAPVIMAGLGTGMAPFRAFIQERAHQHSMGIKVGPMSLYFGSRSMFQEYLYGDELEAYHQSGLLTHLRCAFSRDGPKKVYIQHKIQEDGRTLHDYLGKSNGQFYLCGPTWPAGDVQDAITAAFEQYGGLDPAAAAAAITELKEHERYILEVY